MTGVRLLLAAHCHQPVGNFGWVLEENFQKAYQPFVEVLERHPGVKFGLHYSGPLWEFFEEKHPQFIETLKRLVDRGQVELWTGGLYEPILAAIPEADAIGQVKALTAKIKHLTGASPKGLWLTERVFEPTIPSVLFRAGVSFTAVDDTQFLSAGLSARELTGAFTAEHLGEAVAVFPIHKRMRYLVPFRPVPEVIEHLRSLTGEGEVIAAILADDGEKFGAWPDTHEWVYGQGWLEGFFTAIEQNAGWLTTQHFGAFLSEFPPCRSVHLPAGSYEELEEWALPPERQPELEALRASNVGAAGLVRGGHWKNFLDRYPEANRLHKKMLRVSRKISALGDRPLSPHPFELELFRGQCNDAYWHGVFGGLYLNYLRHAAYESLLRAESAADALLEAGRPYVKASVEDFDADGRDEVILESDLLSVIADPDGEGGLIEVDWRPAASNLADNMTRRFEAYHRKLIAHAEGGGLAEVASIHDRVRSKEPGLADRITYDRWTRAAGVPLALPAGCNRLRYERDGGGAEVLRREDGPPAVAVTTAGPAGGTCEARWTAPGLAVSHKLTRDGSGAAIAASFQRTPASASPGGRFAVEWNLSLLAGNAPDRYFMSGGVPLEPPHLAGEGETASVSEITAVDEWQRIECRFDLSPPAELWRFPIETISLSESGFERVYQQTCLVFLWPEEVASAPGGVQVSFRVTDRRP